MTTPTNTPAVAHAVAAERTRCAKIADLCPETKLGAAARAAIANGQTVEAFATSLALASKAGPAARILNLAARIGHPSVLKGKGQR